MKDPEIREILKRTELNCYINDNDTIVVDELILPIAKARIDIAVVNGSFYGFEIKGSGDSLARLDNQIRSYTKIFDYLSIVTEKKYTKKILEKYPKWIGVIECCDSEKSLRYFRRPKRNKKIEGAYIANLLWKPEILEIIEERRLKINKATRNWLLCEFLAANIEVNELSNIVRTKIKSRTDWR